jgi:hypothetical protein
MDTIEKQRGAILYDILLMAKELLIYSIGVFVI